MYTVVCERVSLQGCHAWTVLDTTASLALSRSRPNEHDAVA